MGITGSRNRTRQNQLPRRQTTTNENGFRPPSQFPNPNQSHQYTQSSLGRSSLPRVSHSSHRYPCSAANPPIAYVEYQKAVTVRNTVNIKKESIRVEEDDEPHLGKHVVAFKFDAMVAGSITVAFFTKEGDSCNLIPLPPKESLLQPVTVSFMEGLGQEFRQPSGTGINFSLFKETELADDVEDVYPLVIKADSCVPKTIKLISDANRNSSQITLAVFDKKNSHYTVQVKKQILWINSTRYELQEIYGIGHGAEDECGDNDSGKECVICLSEPKDITVLPCRHLCMCSACAKVLQLQTNRCPICRHQVERLLEIKVNGESEAQ